MPSGCQVSPAVFRQRWLSDEGRKSESSLRSTGNRKAVELDSSRLSPLLQADPRRRRG